MSHQHHDTSKPDQRFSTRSKIEELPDEIIIHIIGSLSFINREDLLTLKSLDLASHKFHDLINDPVTMLQQVKSQMPFEMSIFWGTVWSPRTLARLHRYREQSLHLLNVLDWGNLLKGGPAYWYHPHRDGFPTEQWKEVVPVALVCLCAMNGLEDNKPNRDLLVQLPFPCLVALHYTTMMIARRLMGYESRALLHTHNFHVPGQLSSFHLYVVLRGAVLQAAPVGIEKLTRWSKEKILIHHGLSRFDILTIDGLSSLEKDVWPHVQGETLQVYPDIWLRKKIAEEKGKWWKRTNGGTTKTAFENCGLSTEGQAAIIRCLQLWKHEVPVE